MPVGRSLIDRIPPWGDAYLTNEWSQAQTAAMDPNDPLTAATVAATKPRPRPTLTVARLSPAVEAATALDEARQERLQRERVRFALLIAPVLYTLGEGFPLVYGGPPQSLPPALIAAIEARSALQHYGAWMQFVEELLDQPPAATPPAR